MGRFIAFCFTILAIFAITMIILLATGVLVMEKDVDTTTTTTQESFYAYLA